MKYNVHLEFYKNIEVEGENKEKAIENAKLEIANKFKNFFVSNEEVLQFLDWNFSKNHDAEEMND